MLVAFAQRLPEPLVRNVYEHTPVSRARLLVAERQLAREKRQLAREKRHSSKLQQKLQQKVGDARGQARASQVLLRRIPRFEYGSFTPGVPGWSERWREAHGKRVLMFGPKDYSGSLLKWGEAVNAHSDYAARVVALQGSQFAHNLDLVLPHPGPVEAELDRLLEETDVIHLKDECFFSDEVGPLATAGPYFDDLREKILGSGKPIVFTHYGGWARSLRHDPVYRQAVRACAGRVAMTPDLAYDWFDGHFIPHLIDTDRFPYAWQDTAKVSHSPSTRARKATDTFLEASEGLSVEVEIIEGVPHAECVARKRSAGLFFDQAGAEMNPRLGVTDVIGWYGNSALEAAVYGVPTIAHLSDHAFEGARRCGKDIERRCAILNAPRGTDGLRAVMRDFFASSSSERREVSERTREWIKAFHGYATGGSELGALYEGVLSSARSPISV
jgi:hypothetical protein